MKSQLQPKTHISESKLCNAQHPSAAHLLCVALVLTWIVSTQGHTLVTRSVCSAQQMHYLVTAPLHISQPEYTLNTSGLAQNTMVTVYSSKKCCNHQLISTTQPTWGVAEKKKTFERSAPTAQIKLALPINLQTLDQELTTGYRHGNVFKQCQPIKASHKAVQLISPQSQCSLKLAGLKPLCGSNLWKTVRPPKNVAMVNETERDRGRRKGQTNTLYIPRAHEGNLPRC